MAGSLILTDSPRLRFATGPDRTFSKACLQPIQPRQRKIAMSAPATKSDPKSALL